MRQKNQYGVLVSFLIFTVCCVLLAAGAMQNSQTVSQQENRLLQSKPIFSAESYLSGAYFRQWESYISDHILHRDKLLQLSAQIEQGMGCSFGSAAQIIETGADIGVSDDKDGAEPAPQAREQLLVLEDRLLELYTHDTRQCAAYAAVLNEYARWLPEQIEFYHMLIPMAVAFSEETYQQVSDDQQQAIAEVYQQLDERIGTVDVYHALEQHQTEDIYFRTDHHWTALGAYYGAEVFAEQAGWTLPALESYEMYTMDSYLGQLALNHLTPQLQQHPEPLTYYLRPGHNQKSTMYFYENGQTKSFTAPMINIDFNQKKADYGIFISGDYPYTVIEGEARNGRVLAVVKDSYGNALIPWLTTGYDRIVAIDPRTCQENLQQLLTQYQVTDFLLLDYVKVIMTAAYGQQLKALLDMAG